MKITCVGPFCDSNFGDYAMLVNDIYSLGKHEYTVFTYNEELLQELVSSYLKDYQVESCIVKTTFQYQAAVSEKYHVEYDTAAYTPVELLAEIENKEEIRAKLSRSDVVIVIGGGYFNHVWNAKHRKAKLLSILGPVLIANEMKKRIVFLGNTYGPFDESQEMYTAFFNSLDNVSLAARDDVYSIANLRRLGITSPVTLLPDDLYFPAPQFPAPDSCLLQALPKNYLILELYASIDELREKLNLIKDFIIQIKKQYQLDVVFFPLDHKFGGEYQAEFLAENIPQLIYFDFQGQAFRKVEDVQKILQHAKIVLCQRYHLFVFAIANNIPAVQILKDVCKDKRYYYSKVKGLLRQVFKHQTVRDEFFIALEIDEGMSFVLKHLNDIQKEQNACFNQTKQMDEKEMQQRREEYIQKILLPPTIQ